MKLIEGTVVLCTVKKIEKTNIFLEIEGNGEGIMILPEVAAGRIRNLRDYIAPNKKVVCKILSIERGQINLSLRRVTTKEKEIVLEKHKKEKSFENMLKTIIKNPLDKIKNIKKEQDFSEFLIEVKENPSTLEKFFTKEESKKILEMLKEKIQKEKIVKKTFELTSSSPTGLNDIKEILNIDDGNITYLGSSKFCILIKAENFKEANKKLQNALKKIEKKAKDKKASFKLIEK